MHGEHHGNNYGTDLPSFSFDFSEYFISAMIERSTNANELYLTMFVLSHNVIDDGHSLRSISTEDEILHQWSYTLKTWKYNTFNDYNNLACIIKNNDRRSTSPYYSHLSWISEHRNDTVEILRCRLKGISNNSDIVDYSSISVDIIRRKGRYHNVTRNHDQSSALISFSVPWYKRSVGYGFSFLNSTYFDPWSNRDSDLPKSYICTSLIRPLNPLLSLVGIPTVLEYVEHHILLGFDHIFLPILLDWNSKYMQRYLTALKSYIASGHVSVISLALKGHDDVSGFNGVHINNQLAERIFMNTCIYLSKGIAKYVVSSKANQFIVPVLDSLHSTYHHYLNKSSEQNNRRNLEGIASSPRDGFHHHGHQLRSAIREKVSKKIMASSNNINTTANQCCAYVMSSFIFSEPEETNSFIRGAGDDAWPHDFYNNSMLTGPYRYHKGVHFLFVDFIYSWSDFDKFSCRFPSMSTLHRDNKIVSSNYSRITEEVSAKRLSVLQYGWDNFEKLQKPNKHNYSDIISFKEKYWTQSVIKLKGIDYDTIESIKNMKKISDGRVKTNKGDIPLVGRASMKPPFWLILDNRTLRQVLTERYDKQ